VPEFLAFLVAGGVSGSFYAIMASGLVLSYSTSGVFNFAYGAIAYVVALLYYELNTGLHWSIVPSVLVSVFVFAPALGLVLDRVMFRRLASAGTTPQIVATVCLSVALPALAVFAVGSLINDAHWDLADIDNILTVPGLGPTPPVAYSLGNAASINTDQVAALVAAICAGGLLWFVTQRTTIGLEMRATVDQRALAGLRKVNPDRSSGIAWASATALAGLTGVLAAPIISLQSNNFTALMLVSAAAAVCARFRSIPIAFAAGIGLGLVQDIVAGYLGPHVSINGFAGAVPFCALLLGLVLLNRDPRRVGGAPSEEPVPRHPVSNLPPWRRGLPWGAAGALLVIFTLGLAPDLWVDLVVSGLCVSLIFLSFVVVTGMGGMVSLAQATFVTVAGMIAGLLLSHHVNFDLALLAGVATAGLLGALVALPALRLGGLLLALATLALALIGDLVLFQIGPLFNQGIGWTIPNPTIGPWQLHSERSIAILMFAVVGAAIVVVRNVQRSPSGRSVLAVRSASIAAASVGISPLRARVTIFVLSAAIAGTGGVLYGSFNGLVNAQDFPAETGLLWLAIIVVLGVRKPGNAVIAGLVYTVFPYLLTYVTTSTQVPYILFGLGGIALARDPYGALAGLAARLSALAERWSARRHRGRAVVPPRPDRPKARVPAVPPAIAGPRPPGAPGTTPADDGSASVPALQLVDIRAGYDGVEVLHGVTIELRAGAVVGVLGANGAGKSTLCQVAAGILTPTSGQVLLGKQDASGRPSYWRSRQGLLAAPEGPGIFARMTVDDNLRLMLPKAEDRDIVYGRFAVLASRRSVAAGLLSGGEQKLLSLAPLLANRPKVLIADEPTLGLAPTMAHEVFSIIYDLRDDGAAVLIIEEKTREVLQVADHLVVLHLGSIVWTGHPQETSPERLAAGYLGINFHTSPMDEAATLDASGPQQ
jgi:ABC-type branched-subunit amino acid transport system ATPase component/branched-subunit amino acid ABC-type transport system permease component